MSCVGSSLSLSEVLALVGSLPLPRDLAPRCFSVMVRIFGGPQRHTRLRTGEVCEVTRAGVFTWLTGKQTMEHRCNFTFSTFALRLINVKCYVTVWVEPGVAKRRINKAEAEVGAGSPCAFDHTKSRSVGKLSERELQVVSRSPPSCALLLSPTCLVLVLVRENICRQLGSN